MSATYVSIIRVSLGDLELLIHLFESLESLCRLKKVIE